MNHRAVVTPATPNAFGTRRQGSGHHPAPLCGLATISSTNTSPTCSHDTRSAAAYEAEPRPAAAGEGTAIVTEYVVFTAGRMASWKLSCSFPARDTEARGGMVTSVAGAGCCPPVVGSTKDGRGGGGAGCCVAGKTRRKQLSIHHVVPLLPAAAVSTRQVVLRQMLRHTRNSRLCQAPLPDRRTWDMLKGRVVRWQQPVA